MVIDKKTKNYFAHIKQVFLYLGDQCNLLCEQCLYKPNVIRGKAIQPGTAKDLLQIFRDLGAFKLSILGGEVSLYDCEHHNQMLIDLLAFASAVGYDYIRIDTNGQHNEFFRNPVVFEQINEVSFSIDGYDPLTNDQLRGKNTFNRSLENLHQLRKTAPDVKINITACVTKQNTMLAGGILPFIENMIQFAHANRISQLNFHGVFRMGVPMDVWTGDSHLDPVEWYEAVQSIRQNVADNKYPIDVRFPIHIITRDEFDRAPRYYGYCPCKLGERALIHPDGIIRVCSSLLSTPYGVAHYNAEQICWNEFNNELQEHKMDVFTPCTNQKALYIKGYCPVCFSLKPYQDEVVWNRSKMERLNGEGSGC